MPVKPGPVLAIYDSQTTRLLALRVISRIDTISLDFFLPQNQGYCKQFSRKLAGKLVRLFDGRQDLFDT